MQYYQTRIGRVTGSSFSELRKKAMRIFDEIKNRSKRKPYIRSLYFKKEKIFLEYFWEHLFTKQNRRDRMRRLRFYGAAIELLQNGTLAPLTEKHPDGSGDMLYRFYGKTPDGAAFIVQIKEHRKSGQRFFISVFPEK